MNGQIRNLHDLNAILTNGPYAWPGGYPLYFIMADGEAMSFDAIKDNKGEVFASFGGPATEVPSPDPQWRPIAFEINWESEDLTCAHTGKTIECAYPSDEEECPAHYAEEPT